MTIVLSESAFASSSNEHNDSLKDRSGYPRVVTGVSNEYNVHENFSVNHLRKPTNLPIGSTIQLLVAKIQHGDILMYSQGKNIKGRRVAEDTPPLIDDILKGLRSNQERIAKCLTIDVDHAALLENARFTHEELMHRTGTPGYMIARGVCAGAILQSSYVFDEAAMPALTGDALRLYVDAHGQDRYDQYNEVDDTTYHGGAPPRCLPRKVDPASIPKFTYRSEHDAESIWWLLLTVSLRVRPLSSAKELHMCDELARIWRTLNNHSIPLHYNSIYDDRHRFFEQPSAKWERLYTPEMKDFAALMFSIADHVGPEYAMWTWKSYREDHLHEAMQRLLLQYLADHRDNPILALDVSCLRPTKAAPVSLDQMPIQTGLGGAIDLWHLISTPTALQNSEIHKGGDQTRSTSSACTAVDSFSNTVHEQTSKTKGRSEANTDSGLSVVGSKRKTTSQSGRDSKCGKGTTGSAVSTRNEDGNGEED